jgi:hypothetical protein
MRFAALIVWFVTALWGLYMLAVWLIENDATRQGNSATRLPLPVILAHVVFALTGLVVWVAYLLLDRPALAWSAVGILVAIALLGLSMFARWIPVYRMAGDDVSVPVGATAGAALAAGPGAALAAGPGTAPGSPGLRELPAEGSFPLFIVLAHGACAVSTVILVVLTALGVGGS